DHYNPKGFVFVREEPVEVVRSLDDPGVAAFSTYVWNWEMSVATAREIKQQYPRCLIVFGGPQVPDPERLDNFFESFPFIDIAVHGEGEVTFSEILTTHAQGGNYLSINGLSCKDGTTPPRTRTPDLNVFPSPYLTGIFEDLFELPFSYQTVWETNRGCPYGCTFCD